jgi:lipopolysaccharide/colanic/teichoic acid biosynthesis glycosyltransferase
MIKRLTDFLTALILLILLFFPLCVLIFFIYVRLGSPVLFVQMRSGKCGKPFKLLKFRSMTNQCGPDGKLLPDADRLTSFGCWLRSTSLDEVPELLNVLRGHMSLVGPRPLLIDYTNYYSSEQARRLEVLPGITGWAQINGRNALEWEKRFELDVWYVDNRNLCLDIKILWLTIKKVLRREGINPPGNITMPAFSGKPHDEK